MNRHLYLLERKEFRSIGIRSDLGNVLYERVNILNAKKKNAFHAIRLKITRGQDLIKRKNGLE